MEYLSTVRYGELRIEAENKNWGFYPHTANGNNLKIEESRLVDKMIEKQMMINLESSNHMLTKTGTFT